jgi:hypothetical protein
MRAHLHGAIAMDRRTFVKGAVGSVAAAGLAPGLVGTAAGTGKRPDHAPPLPAPKPIPGGLQIPDVPLLHVFVPGPEGVTLPFTQTPLMGLDVEPSTITDYKGATAMAYLVGTATGSDGKDYDLEVDIRGYEGQYVAADGSLNFGTFGFI